MAGSSVLRQSKTSRLAEGLGQRAGCFFSAAQPKSAAHAVVPFYGQGMRGRRAWARSRAWSWCHPGRSSGRRCGSRGAVNIEAVAAVNVAVIVAVVLQFVARCTLHVLRALQLATKAVSLGGLPMKTGLVSSKTPARNAVQQQPFVAGQTDFVAARCTFHCSCRRLR